MQDTLIDQGLTLMLAGMGTVFVFLTALVIAMSLMSFVVGRLQSGSSKPTGEEVAAISAAITKHRSQHPNS